MITKQNIHKQQPFRPFHGCTALLHLTISPPKPFNSSLLLLPNPSILLAKFSSIFLILSYNLRFQVRSQWVSPFMRMSQAVQLYWDFSLEYFDSQEDRFFIQQQRDYIDLSKVGDGQRQVIFYYVRNSQRRWSKLAFSFFRYQFSQMKVVIMS